ncbi:putative competence-damage inducible protein [Candidatus Entotheonellaceae bacterium PAL068K]
MAKTTGILVIGNEILSGKVVDTNSPHLCQELRALGVDVRRITVIPDDITVIAEDVATFARRFDYVFTTGGVGPTHDDVTLEAIAQGFNRRMVIHPEIETLLQQHWGDRSSAARKKMASVPEDAQLLMEPSLPIPVLLVENVYIFPGIPQLFRRQFDSIKERFRDHPYHARQVYVTVVESSFSHRLDTLVNEFPDLMLGSYPEVSNPEYRVKLTLESKDPAYLVQAHERLLALLPPDYIAKIE